jgi:hypothetical protein
MIGVQYPEGAEASLFATISRPAVGLTHFSVLWVSDAPSLEINNAVLICMLYQQVMEPLVTIFMLCLFQDDYQHLVQGLLDSQQDQLVAERLAKAFTELTSNITLNTERQNRIKFRDNFEKFIVNVHGFLLVK